MIRALQVTDLATLARVSVNWAPGFTALTGETGAGKSLLIDAIGLAMGGRADATMIRTGAHRATVVLEVEVGPALAETLRGMGFTPDEDTLVLQREVTREGRSQARVNGQPCTAGQLKQIGRLLVDLHGQHDHQALLDPLGPVQFLDDWIGEPAHQAREAVAEAFAQWEAARDRLRHQQRNERERAQRVDLLRFQVQEIDDAGLTVGEHERIETLYRRLQHAQRIAESIRGALGQLADDEVNAQTSMASAKSALESAAQLDDTLAEPLTMLEESQTALREATRLLYAYSRDLDTDPASLEQAQERRDLIRNLHRKYGETDEAVLTYRDAAAQELLNIENAEADETRLRAAEAEARTALDQQAAALTSIRTEAAPRFATRVQEQLHELGLDRTQFIVRVEPVAISPTGADIVQFDFTANAGEEPRPLAKVASGGELARIMLAIKVASAGRAGVPTVVFDEIDTGLSGKAAARVAKKIEEFSAHAQVLVISHLPQMAARADTHLHIEKAEHEGRTLTQVRELIGEDRVDEIARMLAGEQIAEEARANARTLLGTKVRWA